MMKSDSSAREELTLPRVYGVDETVRPHLSRFDYVIGIPAIVVGVLFILVLAVLLVPFAIIRSLFGRIHDVLEERRVRSRIPPTSGSIHDSVYSMSDGGVRKPR
ncbi:hypothetical protein SAMN03159496_04489 [Rhizobium sp. NFR07]|uniref:hypothetical protein n=1 Tax=Rhizobium sp. NFR07 TaxID=1566262 RepID=UPI0008EA43F2|nr:hypothetical protein [Rhizobium sp. NFR07]SFB50980.1 hypothetical protein SAMN03159496_04489 [Rhizobium sp. NFR07]